LVQAAQLIQTVAIQYSQPSQLQAAVKVALRQARQPVQQAAPVVVAQLEMV
jgi:hypothetical protein